MRIITLIHNADIIQLDIEELIDALKRPLHGDIVLQLHLHDLIDERFEEAEEQHRLAREKVLQRDDLVVRVAAEGAVAADDLAVSAVEGDFEAEVVAEVGEGIDGFEIEWHGDELRIFFCSAATGVGLEGRVVNKWVSCPGFIKAKMSRDCEGLS